MRSDASNGDLDGIQTHDLQNRNLTLYSAKLRGLTIISWCKNSEKRIICQRNGHLILLLSAKTFLFKNDWGQDFSLGLQLFSTAKIYMAHCSGNNGFVYHAHRFARPIRHKCRRISYGVYVYGVRDTHARRTSYACTPNVVNTYLVRNTCVHRTVCTDVRLLSD